VPEHWVVKRLKWAADVFPSNVDKKAHEGEDPVVLCNYTDVYYNDRITDAIDFMPATGTRDQITKFSLRAGDTIITKDSETPDDIAVGSYVPQDLPGVVCGYHLAIVRPCKEVVGEFVKRLFDSHYLRAVLSVRANGLTRFGLSQSAIVNTEIPLPPIPEQHAIATFLDRETAKIDALVAEQRRLIELLKEKRQAVISHAVTKGLDPNVPMKDSGVEWIGEVPEHWEVIPLKRVASMRSGESITANSIEFDGVFPVYGGNGLRGYTDKYTHEGNFVLVGRQGALCGNVNYAEGKFWASEHALVVTPNQRIDPTWLGELLRCMNLNQYSMSAAQPGLSVEVISGLRIPIPKHQEQVTIAQFLRSEMDRSESLVAECQHAISLLLERRTALISAAVTGKIDVRGMVDADGVDPLAQ